MRGMIVGTAGLSIVVAMTVIGSQIQFGWLDGIASARDATAQELDWTSLRDDLTSRGLLRPGTVVGVPNWRDAGKIAYALGPDVTVICPEPGLAAVRVQRSGGAMGRLGRAAAGGRERGHRAPGAAPDVRWYRNVAAVTCHSSRSGVEDGHRRGRTVVCSWQ